MNHLLFPILIYLVLAAIYLIGSGAPVRVHILLLVIGFLAIPVSSWMCCAGASTPQKLAIAFACALGCFILWDVTAPFVISKAETMGIFYNTPWVYCLVVIILGSIIYAISFLSDLFR